MEEMLNKLYLDMYSKRTSFFYKKKEKIGSFFGFFLTLLYIIISILLFINQIILILNRGELKVYDTTMYAQEMPSIEIDSNNFYFAFGLEDPKTSDRFIDDSIYVPKIMYIDKVKVNDELKTVDQKVLEFEKCKVENFGENFQNLFIKNELNSSYCLKKFNKSLTFAGGYKYERMSYIRIRIYPCVNTTENNNSCRSQEDIDYYMSAGYFSIIFKDFGLNPTNYSFPVLPTLQDLYTTIDKRLIKNYILNFGVTEVHTDTGLFMEQLNVDKYLMFRKELQTFSFREEEQYYSGKSVILVQIKLDDTLVVQKRVYTKFSEIFSRIGGYMQLMNTVFLLLTSIINRIHSDLKIINSIFSFNLKKNKVILKFQTLKESNFIINPSKQKLLVFSKKSKENLRVDNDIKSKNNFIIKANDLSDLSGLNSSNNKNNNDNYIITINRNRNNIVQSENTKVDSIKSKNEYNVVGENLQKNNFDNCYLFRNETGLKDFNDHIDLNVINYICMKRNAKRLKLFYAGNNFYRKKMDIVHVFTLITIIEKVLLSNNNFQNLSALYEEIELIS